MFFNQTHGTQAYGRQVLFCCFISQVNSYGYGGTVSSSNLTFFLGELEQAVNQFFNHILWLVTDNNPSRMIQRKRGEWL